MSQQKSKNTTRFVLATVVCAGSLLTTTTWASYVTPGQRNAAPDTSVSASAFAAMSPIFDENAPFVGTNSLPVPQVTFIGTLDSRVYNDPVTGFLDFAYQVTSDAASPDAILHVTASSFAGYTTDVYDILGTGGFEYDGVSRNPSGATLSLDYSASTANNIQPGGSTMWVLVKTNALYYTLGTAAVTDGGVANPPALAPLPEPSSLSFIVIGAGMFIARRRRA